MSRRPASALGQLAQIAGLAALGGGVWGGICLYKGDQGFYRGVMELAARSGEECLLQAERLGMKYR